MNKNTAFLANAFYSTDFDNVKYIEKGLFCVDENGFIKNVVTNNDKDYINLTEKYKSENSLTVFSDDEIIIPGFVDTHIHASQWPQAGTALDKPLEIWLGEYTFPLESKYRDLSFAEKVYTDIIKTTLKYGTTTAVYFATVDREPSVLLADLCGKLGQRGLVGKVVMDDVNSNPDYCRDLSADTAVSETEQFINEVTQLQNKYKQKVYPVITPRFIPSCSDECLEKLGKLAQKHKIHIQTHCSESDWAHGYVKERFGINDAQALDKFGFITDKTILAHATFLDDKDLKLLSEKGASISHCPLSNAYFASSVLPLKEFYGKGVNISVATDISGGYHPSMYTAVRQAVVSSRMLNEGVNPSLSRDLRGRKNSAITLNNAFYCATAGGGNALKLPIGKLEKGYSFDVQVIDTSKNIPLFYKEKNPIDLLHKILLLSEPDNIKQVWVQGVKVK